MRSKTNNGSNYEQRVAKTIKEAREIIINNPKESLFNSKQKHIFRMVCTGLVKIGVIVNAGTKKHPYYMWDDDVVINDKLANKTTAIIREDMRKRYPSSKTAKMEIDTVTKKGKKATKKTVTDTTEVKKEFFINKTEAPKFSEPTLSNFSSQALWNELKNRGFGIVGSTIQKIEVTTLS